MNCRGASLIAVATVALVATACSSSGSTGGSGTNAAPQSTSGSVSGGSAARGTPVHVVEINDGSDTLPFDDVSVAVKAIQKAVNASGGVNGHPLEITVCSTKGGDQNVGAQCARDAVADKTVVAVVGEWSQTGTTIDPILDQAGLANIGLFPQAANDYASTSAFPLTSGTIGIVAGMVTLAADQLNAKKIGLAYTSSPQGAALPQLLQPIAELHGAKLTASTAIPAGSADVSSNVLATAKGNDAVALSTRGPDSVKYVQSAKQQGITTPLVAPANFDAALIKQLPNSGADLYYSDTFNRTGPTYDQYKKDISAVDSSQVTSLRTINTWCAYQLFLAAAKAATTVDRAGIFSAMKSMTSFSLGGLVPTLNFTKTSTAFGGKFPRLFNETVTYNKMVDGAITPIDGKFHNVFAAKS